jgi:hypothetical protein
MRRVGLSRRVLVLSTVVAVFAFAAGIAWAAIDTEVTVGSNDAIFSQNKQNEPWVAIDPAHPAVLAAGANDNIDMEACNAGAPNTCPFTDGVGGSGIYFSLNGGATWTQPTYTGNSARGCLGPAACVVNPTGPIGTLPWYSENRLTNDGDPSLAFGPKLGTGGGFSWANGTRLYYANLVSGVPGEDPAFKGAEAIAVSRVDNVHLGVPTKAQWMPPVIISRQSSATFSDKEALWVDNAESSPHFGNVYVCNVAFRSNGLGGAPEPVMVARSTDGGGTWVQRQISQAANTGVGAGRSGGRQGCVVRTSSTGTVYVLWRGSFQGEDVLWLSRSFDGGINFDKPRAVAETGTVGRLDPVQRRLTIDGVAGARTNEGPTMDIANGAPSGTGASNAIVIGWNDGQLGLDHERAMVAVSTDGGDSFSTPSNATAAGDRPNFAWVAVSPDGTDIYVVYNAYLDPWRTTTADPRRMQGVVRHANLSGNVVGAWDEQHRGSLGDARGSSANGLTSEFLGDYNYVMATNAGAYAVWNDVRDAAVCPAINAYRQSIVDGTPITAPAPQQDCPVVNGDVFGNTGIFGASIADPS